MNPLKKATIVGDTSQFHLGSKTNYQEFKRLVEQKYDVVMEIPYDEYSTEFIEYKDFRRKVRNSDRWQNLEDSDVIIVHGEGLTEKHESYVYPYLYFSNLAKELGIESQLVNFSMYEIGPFMDYLKLFNYIASREKTTQKLLSSKGIDSELAFDCCVRSVNKPLFNESEGYIVGIKGRAKFDGATLNVDSCWDWNEDSVQCNTLEEYLDIISRSKYALSSSFHGNIFSALAGVPFIVMDKSNPKFEAIERELLPEGLSFNLFKPPSRLDRERIREHYSMLYPLLIDRTKLNVD